MIPSSFLKNIGVATAGILALPGMLTPDLAIAAQSLELSNEGKWLVVRGTVGALKIFPKGSKINGTSKICLDTGDSLTVVSLSSKKQMAVFKGPGCHVKIASKRLKNRAATGAVR